MKIYTYGSSVFREKMKEQICNRIDEFFNFIEKFEKSHPKSRTTKDWISSYQSWARVMKNERQ